MKHLIVVMALAMIGVLATVFLMRADREVEVPCGQDLDATVNADDPTIGTRFQLGGPCTYTVDATVALSEGDEIAGPAGTFTPRGPAFDPQPTVTIVGATGGINWIRYHTALLSWINKQPITC